MHADEANKEKKKTFDLIDALTKSGALVLEHSSLHVILGASHYFDKTLMDTVIEENVNPIDKIAEQSMLIAAASVHRFLFIIFLF